MKTLIIYYSRTGITKKIAEKLSISLNADIEVIIDNIDRKGVAGFLKSGREGLTKKTVKIDDLKYDIKNYDLVVIGSPVWAGYICSPVRSVIEKHKDDFKKIAFFLTQGAGNKQRGFDELDEIFGSKLVSKEFFATKEVVNDAFKDKINNFINKLK